MRLITNPVRKLSQQITRHVCENGAVVITHNSNHAVAAVGLISKGGSRAEIVPGQSSVNRSITLNNLPSVPGINVSSVLHRERTGVYGVCLPNQGTAFANSLIEAANVREVSDEARNHAQNALNSSSGNTKIVMEDYLHMACFQDTPLGRSPYGTTDGISNGNAVDLLDYRDRQYGADNVTIVGVGAVNHDELVEAAAALTPNPGLKTGPLAGNCQFTGSYFSDRNDYIKNCFVKWGYNVPGLDHPSENIGFQVMAEIFGAWKRGDQHAQFSVNPLVQFFTDNKATRRGAHGGHNNRYSVEHITEFEGQLTSYSDTAVFGFYTEVVDADSGYADSLIHNNRLQAVTYRMQGEIKRWSRGFSDHEVAAAKNSLLVKISDRFSNPLLVADDLGTQALISNAPKAFKTYRSLIESVNTRKLNELFGTYLYNQEIASAYYGATEGMPEPLQARNRGWDVLKF